MFFSAAGRRATERKPGRTIEYSYHIEVRTLNARRMFRKILNKIVIAVEKNNICKFKIYTICGN